MKTIRLYDVSSDDENTQAYTSRSPSLFKRPSDWHPDRIDVSGFFFLDSDSNFNPSQELVTFLEAGPTPIYIGFGSIVVDNPSALTRILFDAISMAGVRAVVSEGWSGLQGKGADILDGVFILHEEVPHDWLFPKVSCVVHHGGAGTSAAGLKAGKPTVVVPFFGDQFFWGDMIFKAGAGPTAIPQKTLTSENLSKAIKFCMQPDVVAKAEDCGLKVRQENGVKIGAASFHQKLPVDQMRCSLVPNKAAVWTVKGSSTKLSTFAAAILVDQKILEYSELEL